MASPQTKKDIKPASRLDNVSPSGMRKLFDLANELRHKGKKIFDFGLGDIDIPLLRSMRDALMIAVDTGLTRYGSNPGDQPLREKLVERYEKRYKAKNITIENVLITCGAIESLFDSMLAFLDPGDEIIIHEPSFKYFEYIANLSSAKVVPISTDPEHDFRIVVEQLVNAITPKTKAILMNFPTNPTTSIITLQDMKPIVEIAEEYGLLLISDESYENIYFDNIKHHSFLEFGYANTLVISSFSKSLAMTGLRVGYTIGATPNLLVPISQVHQYNTAHANRPAQYAALAGLNIEEEIAKNNMVIFTKRRQQIINTWSKIPGLKFNIPKATFYVYVDVSDTGMNAKEFCEFAMQQGVILVPGTEFGSKENTGLTNYFRMSFGMTSEESIQQAADILIEASNKR